MTFDHSSQREAFVLELLSPRSLKSDLQHAIKPTRRKHTYLENTVIVLYAQPNILFLSGLAKEGFVMKVLPFGEYTYQNAIFHSCINSRSGRCFLFVYYPPACAGLCPVVPYQGFSSQIANFERTVCLPSPGKDSD